MTANDMMTLRALLEKSSDADLLREMIGFTAQRLPEGDSCGCRRHCVPSFLAVATALI